MHQWHGLHHAKPPSLKTEISEPMRPEDSVQPTVETRLNIPEFTRRHMRILFVAPLRKALLEQVGYGLAVEGISATDLKIAAEEKANTAVP